MCIVYMCIVYMCIVYMCIVNMYIVYTYIVYLFCQEIITYVYIHTYKYIYMFIYLIIYDLTTTLLHGVSCPMAIIRRLIADNYWSLLIMWPRDDVFALCLLIVRRYSFQVRFEVPFRELQSYTAGQLRDKGRTSHRVVTLLITINNCL